MYDYLQRVFAKLAANVSGVFYNVTVGHTPTDLPPLCVEMPSRLDLGFQDSFRKVCF